MESLSDLNGDGLTNLAYIARGEDKRELRVVISYVSETDFGETRAQIHTLDPDLLGDASLVVKNNVLML